MIKCLKSIIKFSASIIGGIGLVILCFGLYVLYNQVGLDYQDLYYNSADWLKTLQEYGFIILGVLILLIGSAGIHGAKKQKPTCQKTCLAIYEIGAITFFLLCSSLAVFTLIYSDDILGQECTGNDYFKEIDIQIQLADQLFCSDLCQCYITNETFQDKQKQFEGKNFTTDENITPKIVQVQKCPSFEVNEYAAAAKMIQAAETLLHCTGWCKSTSYYVFSNVNDNSQNENSCFKETKDFIESTGKITGYVFLGLGLLFGFNVVFVIILCCSNQKKKNRNDYLLYET
ncbi:unnamed protein product [Paramecium sonneborni]|uniref:Tetraspanin family protein n=1 Tax=Paramecium sonneborni TaxID=65129 RepID=A0A8S1KB99_9CILI|nr:unnamed protein product [Paramecium sonneborni]